MFRVVCVDLMDGSTSHTNHIFEVQEDAHRKALELENVINDDWITYVAVEEIDNVDN